MFTEQVRRMCSSSMSIFTGVSVHRTYSHRRSINIMRFKCSIITYRLLHASSSDVEHDRASCTKRLSGTRYAAIHMRWPASASVLSVALRLCGPFAGSPAFGAMLMLAIVALSLVCVASTIDDRPQSCALTVFSLAAAFLQHVRTACVRSVRSVSCFACRTLVASARPFVHAQFNYCVFALTLLFFCVCAVSLFLPAPVRIGSCAIRVAGVFCARFQRPITSQHRSAELDNQEDLILNFIASHRCL